MKTSTLLLLYIQPLQGYPPSKDFATLYSDSANFSMLIGQDTMPLFEGDVDKMVRNIMKNMPQYLELMSAITTQFGNKNDTYANQNVDFVQSLTAILKKQGEQHVIEIIPNGLEILGQIYGYLKSIVPCSGGKYQIQATTFIFYFKYLYSFYILHASHCIPFVVGYQLRFF